MRYLAAKHGYAIEDDIVALQADTICDDYEGTFIGKMNTPGLMHLGLKSSDGREEYIDQLFSEIIPAFLTKIEPLCAGDGKFMFGDKLTIADFWIGGMYVNNFVNPNCPWGQGKWEELLEKFPGFK